MSKSKKLTTILAQGAESIIVREQNTIVKKRQVKTYRLPALDVQLRKSRTRHEIKLLDLARIAGVPTPRVLGNSDDEITMEFIDAPTLRQQIEILCNIEILGKKNTQQSLETLAKNLGQTLAKLHNANIIHNDLTTSNVLVLADKTIAIIDFGLSFISARIEDKAYDMHLLHQAINSYHVKLNKLFYETVLQTYNALALGSIQARLENIELRARNKTE